VRERAAALATEHPELTELLGKIAEGIAVEGMESLAPVLVDDMNCCWTCCRRVDGGDLRSGAGPYPGRRPGATSREFLEASWAASAGGGEAPIDLGAASLWSSRTYGPGRARSHPWWSVSPFAADEIAAANAAGVPVDRRMTG